jgi:hypothetical protein
LGGVRIDNKTIKFNGSQQIFADVATIVYQSQVTVSSWGRTGNSDTENYFDVFPPSGKTMANLIGFIASISLIQFDGDVDKNDNLRCKFAPFGGDRMRVWVSNSEQRGAPAGNFLAIWSNA